MAFVQLRMQMDVGKKKKLVDNTPLVQPMTNHNKLGSAWQAETPQNAPAQWLLWYQSCQVMPIVRLQTESKWQSCQQSKTLTDRVVEGRRRRSSLIPARKCLPSCPQADVPTDSRSVSIQRLTERWPAEHLTVPHYWAPPCYISALTYNLFIINTRLILNLFLCYICFVVLHWRDWWSNMFHLNSLLLSCCFSSLAASSHGSIDGEWSTLMSLFFHHH